MVYTEADPCDNITSYTYDLYGNIATKTMQNGGIYVYSYDVLNRPDSVSFKDNAQSSAVLLKSYSYLILSNGNTQQTETGLFK